MIGLEWGDSDPSKKSSIRYSGELIGPYQRQGPWGGVSCVGYADGGGTMTPAICAKPRGEGRHNRWFVNQCGKE